MTRIYPFQRTARWLSLGFLAMAILLGSFSGALAQDKGKKEVDPRIEEMKKGGLTHDLSGGEVKVIEQQEDVEPPALSPHHAMLRKLEGHWQVQVRMYGAPGEEPLEMSGISRNELVLGGHALEMKYKGDFMGEPFVGIGFDGYDLDRGHHYGIWMDTVSTGVTHDVGVECHHEGPDIVTYEGEAVDPGTGETVLRRTELRVPSGARYTMEEWRLNGDEEPSLSMRLIFSRIE